MRIAVRAVTLLILLPIGFHSMPAWGGDAARRCCVELEEVLSELTGALTGAGKSERSVRIYGQLNRAVMYWDDGKTSGTYAIDNETSSSRLGVIGTHRFLDNLTAGYRVEIDTRATLSSELSSDDALGDLSDGAIRLRHAYWYLQDRNLGRLTFGQQSPATDDITIISLGAKMSDAALHYNNKFELRLSPTTLTPVQAPNPGFRVAWSDLAHTVDTMRGLYVRYDTPTLNGFLLSAAAGEDGVWDVALRYSDGPEWLRLAGGVGFIDDQGLGIRDVKGSFSALHVPTGFFATVAGGLREDYGVTVDTPRDGFFYLAQLGVTKRLFPLGNTTLYAEYGRYNDFGVGRVFAGKLNDVPAAAVKRWLLLDSNVERWGLGIEQEVTSQGLLLYAQFHHYDGGFTGHRCTQERRPGVHPPGPSHRQRDIHVRAMAGLRAGCAHPVLTTATPLLSRRNSDPGPLPFLGPLLLGLQEPKDRAGEGVGDHRHCAWACDQSCIGRTSRHGACSPATRETAKPCRHP